MINAALSGVDVRFMMTGIPDKPIALWAAQTYYRKLLEAGARVFLYEAGFLHAKTIVVDHTVSAVGTMNMDQRSLKLHKELMVWVFDKGFAMQVADAFSERHDEVPRGDAGRHARSAASRSSATRRPGSSRTCSDPPAEETPTAPTDPKPQTTITVVKGKPRNGTAVWIKRAVILALTALGLYVVWPSLAAVFSSGPQLRHVNPLWGIPIVLAEIASFACMWALLRLALDVKPWFPVATAQLAGNAFSRIVPGGAAAGGAMQFDMLRQAGVGTTWAATGVTAVSLISTATLFGLPVISIVSILITGASVERNLFRVGSIAVVVCLGLLAGGAVLLFANGPLHGLGVRHPEGAQPPAAPAQAHGGTARQAGRRARPHPPGARLRLVEGAHLQRRQLAARPHGAARGARGGRRAAASLGRAARLRGGGVPRHDPHHARRPGVRGGRARRHAEPRRHRHRPGAAGDARLAPRPRTGCPSPWARSRTSSRRTSTAGPGTSPRTPRARIVR